MCNDRIPMLSQNSKNHLINSQVPSTLVYLQLYHGFYETNTNIDEEKKEGVPQSQHVVSDIRLPG